jgi:hypothetical protein
MRSEACRQTILMTARQMMASWTEKFLNPTQMLAGCGSTVHRTFEETFEQIYTIESTADITVTNGDGVVFGRNSAARFGEC